MSFENKAFALARDWLSAKSGHVLLISGAKGAGKRALAARISQSILCETPEDAQACGHCAACRYFLAGNHPDYFLLSLEDGEKNIKVAAVREHLLADTIRQPQLGKYKAYVIEADGLNEQGQNALLKTLEEPPPYAYFILTISAEEKLLPTVRSRVVPLRLAPLSAKEMQAALSEKGQHVDASMSRILTSLTNGSLGQAIELLESPWFFELRADLWQHMQTWPKLQRYLLLTEEFNFLNSEKEHYGEIMQILQSLLRDLLALRTGADPKSLVNQDFSASLQHFHKQNYYDGAALEALLTELGKMNLGRQVNENFEMSVCNLMLEFERLRLGR